MKLPKLLLAVASWFVLLRQVNAVEFAVGFSLSLDYGVSSIYYKNGSYVGVAKIEGSPAYKAIMHAQPWGNRTTSSDIAQSSMSLQQMPLLSNSGWRDHLPGWFGGRPNADVVKMSQMMQGLKAATESYLGSKISYVSIATPDEPTEAFSDILSSAASRVPLKQDHVGALQATVWASKANMVEDYFCEEYSRLILSLDYSRAALTATVIEDDCGLPWHTTTLHDRTVGTENWSDASWNKVVPELRQIIADAQVKVGSEAPISKLVLSGESAQDSRLKLVLRDVLLRKDGLHEKILWKGHGSSRDLIKPIDPLFAPAVGVATRALMVMEDEERGHLCQLPVDTRKLSRTLEPQQADRATTQVLGIEWEVAAEG